MNDKPSYVYKSVAPDMLEKYTSEGWDFVEEQLGGATSRCSATSCGGRGRCPRP